MSELQNETHDLDEIDAYLLDAHPLDNGHGNSLEARMLEDADLALAVAERVEFFQLTQIALASRQEQQLTKVELATPVAAPGMHFGVFWSVFGVASAAAVLVLWVSLAGRSGDPSTPATAGLQYPSSEIELQQVANNWLAMLGDLSEAEGGFVGLELVEDPDPVEDESDWIIQAMQQLADEGEV